MPPNPIMTRLTNAQLDRSLHYHDSADTIEPIPIPMDIYPADLVYSALTPRCADRFRNHFFLIISISLLLQLLTTVM